MELDVLIKLDGSITVRYCGKTETGTWKVTDGSFTSTGISGKISFNSQGELLYQTGGGQYLRCTGTKPETNRNMLVIPSSVTEIEEEAFLGTNAECVVIPDGCTKIGARAFGDCSGLTYVYMPDGVEDIDAGAFGNSARVVFICESDNAAARFARRYNIRYFIR